MEIAAGLLLGSGGAALTAFLCLVVNPPAALCSFPLRRWLPLPLPTARLIFLKGHNFFSVLFLIKNKYRCYNLQ